MKRMMTIILALCMMLAMALPAWAGASSLQFTDYQLQLDPNRKCPVQPQVYCNPRYYNEDTGGAYDLSNGLSAKQINNALSNRSYGLYFKFTPHGKDNGYDINRFDVVVTDRQGNKLYIDGFDSDMQCEAGYYWAWNFFPLEGLFMNMRELYGQVIAGQYKMDIYFNGLWAGSVSFKIAN